MEGRCATCKHWQRDTRNMPPADYGACLLAVVMAGDEVKDGVKFWPCCTCDEDNSNQWIETDEDFGCIHWKADSELLMAFDRAGNPVYGGEVQER